MLGVKETVTVQLPPATILPEQGGLPDDTLKSALLVPVIVAFVMITVAVLTFAIVTEVLACVPLVTFPKFTEDGVNLIAVPVPVNETVWGLVGSLSATLNNPVRGPIAVGLKVTLITQVPEFAITRPLVQVVPDAVAKSPDIVSAGLPKVRLPPVLLVRVTVVAPLAVPRACGVAKVTDAGLKVTLLVPVPVKPTICGLVGSESLITTEPFLAPVDCGVNVTEIVQLALPASDEPEAGHVFAEIAKSVTSLSTIVPMVTLVVPLLVRVMVLAALVVFTS